MAINLCGCVVIMGALAESAKAKQNLNVPYSEALDIVRGAFKTLDIRFEDAVIRKNIAEVRGKYVDDRIVRILISKVNDNETLVAVRVGTSEAGKKDAEQILKAIIGRTPAGQPEQLPAGSLHNPIIDSDISLPEALRKESPPEFKERQRLVDVLYYSFDGKIHKGQLVIDEKLVGDIREVFRVALETKFPIASVTPISHDRFFKDGKWNDDDLSMLSDNTSAFNYRTVTGGKSLSKHAYGFAIDINPVQNPYIKGNIVLPSNAVYDIHKPGTLACNSPVVKTFISLGWTWGGNWKSLKDYQHFEKVPPR